MLALSLACAFTSPGLGPNLSQSQKDTWLPKGHLALAPSSFSKLLDLRSLLTRSQEHSGAHPAVPAAPSGSQRPLDTQATECGSKG